MTQQTEPTTLAPEAYHALIEYATDLVAILDTDGTLRFASPSYERTLGYSLSELVGTSAFSRIHPDDVGAVRAAFEEARDSGLSPVTARFRYRHGSGEWRVLEATGTSRLDDPHVRGFIVNSRDITERVRAEEEARQREAQYRDIFNSTRDGLVIINPDGIIVEANAAAVQMHGYTPEEFIGMNPQELLHPESRERLAEAARRLAAGGSFASQAIALRRNGDPFHVEVHGGEFLYHGEPHVLAVLRDITERVKAYELLEQRVRERTSELTAMLDVSRNVASTLELQPLLGLILDGLKTVVDYGDAGLLEIDGEFIQAIGYRGPLPEEAALQLRFRIDPQELTWDVIKHRETVVVDDVRGTSPLARKFQRAVGDGLETTFAYMRSFLSVPLLLKDRVIGVLSLSHPEPGYFTARHAEIAYAIAQQAAIAIENARLYARAQDVATLEERARLARELHDSVTQALFSMTLHARSLQMQLDRAGIPHDSRLGQGIAQLNELTQGALAEMRALIFELRPGALQEEGLIAALRKHTAALGARQEIEIAVEAPVDRIPLAADAEEQLYRLAQEAVNNAVKHAHARQITVRVEITGNAELCLHISDDGIGFDPAGVPPGHLGLTTMAERARLLGGSIEIRTAPGEGTEVCVSVPGALAPGS